MHIYNFLDNDDAKTIAEKGPFKVIEWQRDLSVPYLGGAGGLLCRQDGRAPSSACGPARWSHGRDAAGRGHAVDGGQHPGHDWRQGRWGLLRQGAPRLSDRRVGHQAGVHGRGHYRLRAHVPPHPAHEPADGDGRDHGRQRRALHGMHLGHQAPRDHGQAAERHGCGQRGPVQPRPGWSGCRGARVPRSPRASSLPWTSRATSSRWTATSPSPGPRA